MLLGSVSSMKWMVEGGATSYWLSWYVLSSCLEDGSTHMFSPSCPHCEGRNARVTPLYLGLYTYSCTSVWPMWSHSWGDTMSSPTLRLVLPANAHVGAIFSDGSEANGILERHHGRGRVPRCSRRLRPSKTYKIEPGGGSMANMLHASPSSRR